jgi:hypothetical protein
MQISLVLLFVSQLHRVHKQIPAFVGAVEELVVEVVVVELVVESVLVEGGGLLEAVSVADTGLDEACGFGA